MELSSGMHVPRKISSIYSLFLRRGGIILYMLDQTPLLYKGRSQTVASDSSISARGSHNTSSLLVLHKDFLVAEITFKDKLKVVELAGANKRLS